MRRVVLIAAFASVAAVVLVLPPVARAQQRASIVGVVQDSTGGIMPGVTVEASSPAMIEQLRSAVSDGSGRYAIIDLRPGTYSVTFTLPGFKSVKREGIVLEGAFSAQVNGTLSVGAVEETVTVTGASPVVDTQSTQNQSVLNRQALDVLPAARTMQGGASLIAVGGKRAWRRADGFDPERGRQRLLRHPARVRRHRIAAERQHH